MIRLISEDDPLIYPKGRSFINHIIKIENLIAESSKEDEEVIVTGQRQCVWDCLSAPLL